MYKDDNSLEENNGSHFDLVLFENCYEDNDNLEADIGSDSNLTLVDNDVSLFCKWIVENCMCTDIYN